MLAEDHGFDSVWVGEHHGRPDQCPSPLLVLSHIAARTRRVRLGTGSLLVPLYHPVRLAEEVAMLDQLSGGRVILGASPGYVAEEFTAFGLAPEEKARRLVEGLTAVRRLLREPNVDFEGEFFRFRNVTIVPRAVQPDGPEVWLGVGGPKLIQRSVDLADRFYIGMPASLEQIRTRIAIYREALERKGEEFSSARVALNRQVFVTADRRKRELAERRAAEVLSAQYRRYGNPDVLGRADEAAAGAENTGVIIGSPEECVVRIRQLESLGVGYLVADMHCIGRESALESLRLFASRVRPQFI